MLDDGAGTLLSAILQAAPATQGVLLDTRPVVTAAEPVLRAAGIAHRCRSVAGNFFDEVPPDADLYISATSCTTGTTTAPCASCGRVGQPCADSRLLVIELVLPDDARPSMGKLLDLEMLSVTPNGRQRSEAQYEQLFDRAGT